MTTYSVDDLSDREAIRHVLALYSRASDRLDLELLRSLFHPNAVLEFGAFNGDVEGFVQHVRNNLSALELSQHSLGTVIVEVQGDIAFTEAYFVSRSVCALDEPGQREVRELYGRYIDRFERREGVWRIARRVCVKDFRDVRRLPMAELQTDAFVLGERGRGDMAYRIRSSVVTN